jgi:hypothetical protein
MKHSMMLVHAHRIEALFGRILLAKFPENVQEHEDENSASHPINGGVTGQLGGGQLGAGQKHMLFNTLLRSQTVISFEDARAFNACLKRAENSMVN